MDRKRYTETMDQSKWRHGCPKCEFLVSIEDRLPGTSEIGWMDIYHSCDNIGVPILIRFGNDQYYITTDGIGCTNTYKHLEDVFDHFFTKIYVRNLRH